MTSSVQPTTTITTTSAAAAAARPGWRTSEFWLSVVAVAATLFAPAIDSATSGAADRLSTRGVGGAIAAGAIVGAYTVTRGIVKAAATKAAAGGVPAIGVSSSSSAAAPRQL